MISFLTRRKSIFSLIIVKKIVLAFVLLSIFKNHLVLNVYAENNLNINQHKNVQTVKKLHKTHTNENYARSVKNLNSYSIGMGSNHDTEVCKLNIECNS